MLSFWALAQTGVAAQLAAGANAWLHSAGTTVRLGVFFDLAGWQLVFFSGLCLGYLQAEGRLDLGFLKQPRWTPVFYIGLAMLAYFALLDRIVWDFWFGAEFTRDFLIQHARTSFSSLYLLAFALDLFLVTWLLVAGRDCGHRATEAAARGVEWLFTRRPLVFLGQHSLQVFSAHILLVYTLSIAFHDRHLPVLAANLVVLFSPAPLFLAAWLHQRAVAQGKARRAAIRAA